MRTTDDELSQDFGLSRRTVIRWRQDGVDFGDPAEVAEHALRRRATRPDTIKRLSTLPLPDSTRDALKERLTLRKHRDAVARILAERERVEAAEQFTA